MTESEMQILSFYAENRRFYSTIMYKTTLTQVDKDAQIL